MTPKDFQTKWISKENNLQQFQEGQLSDVNLNSETKDFLINIGLPDNAAPYLSFEETKEDNIRTADQVFRLGNAYRRYVIIGFNGYGDPICIDAERGNEIWCLDHEVGFEPEFMNSSIQQLAYFLLVYREFIEYLQTSKGEDAWVNCEFTDEEFLKFQNLLIQIDEPALEEDTYWNVDLGILLANRE